MGTRIHIDEFLANHDLSTMVQAGFKSYVTKTWMFLEEWEGKLQEYLDR
jgi:hypothetical protein